MGPTNASVDRRFGRGATQEALRPAALAANLLSAIPDMHKEHDYSEACRSRKELGVLVIIVTGV